MLWNKVWPCNNFPEQLQCGKWNCSRESAEPGRWWNLIANRCLAFCRETWSKCHNPLGQLSVPRYASSSLSQSFWWFPLSNQLWWPNIFKAWCSKEEELERIFYWAARAFNQTKITTIILMTAAIKVFAVKISLKYKFTLNNSCKSLHFVSTGRFVGIFGDLSAAFL